MDYLIKYAFLLSCAAVFPPATSSPALILTPYIENNQPDLARNLSRVDPSLFLNVTSHSGYLTVDVAKNSNLFFWYFPVAGQPLNATPWVVWLQGGPGATSLAGLFDEIGPFQYDEELKVLKMRKWSWGKEFSLLFIDNPVGAGFSFTDSNDGYVRNMNECSEQLYGALQQFLELFPAHRRAPLYLAGESYAGHYVPALAHKVLHPPPEVHKTALQDTTINLQGLMMGNPIIDRQDEVDLTSAYYQWGLLDRQGVLAAKPLQDRYKLAVKENDYVGAYKLRNELEEYLSKVTYQLQNYNILKDGISVDGFSEFLRRPDIAEAIHVGNIAFTFSNATVHEKLLPDFLSKTSGKIEELLGHYRVLIYCGQLDQTAPCVVNAEARRRWRWQGQSGFLAAPRKPWWFNETIAGYVKSGGNLTEVLVRGSGHLVPIDKPAQAQQLASYFIRGLDLPLPINFNENEIETPPYADDTDPIIEPEPNEINSRLVASAVLNVIFGFVIILGIIYWVRWKRRTDSFFYNMVDNSSLNDGVLTMN